MKFFGSRRSQSPPPEGEVVKVAPVDRLIVLAERNMDLARDLQLLIRKLQDQQGGRA